MLYAFTRPHRHIKQTHYKWILNDLWSPSVIVLFVVAIPLSICRTWTIFLHDWKSVGLTCEHQSYDDDHYHRSWEKTQVCVMVTWQTTTKWDWGEKGRKKACSYVHLLLSRIHYCLTKAVIAVVPVHLPVLSQENWRQLSDVNNNVLSNDIHSPMSAKPQHSVYSILLKSV